MFGKYLLAAATLVLLTGSANASVVFSQAANASVAHASQNDPKPGGFGAYATVYDDFTLGASANLTSVNFTGVQFNGTPGPITSFTVAIYGDAAGIPGSQLFITNVAGNGGETMLGLDGGGNQLYGYSENLSFAATGGTKYWLSIVADLVYPPQWGWADSTSGNNAAYQLFFGVGTALTNDQAFTLNGDAIGGTAVPEPLTLSLFGAGLAGALVLRRRKAKQA